TAQSVLKDAVPLFETTYDYDCAGNLTHRRDSVQGVDEYRYDVIGRLLQHTDPKGRIERFFNDPAGDRLATRVQQVQLRKVVGGDDEQQVQWTREGTYDGVHYVFDRAGDLVRKGSPNGPEPDDLELVWDANHRLAESRKAGQTTHYGYDPLGRRVFKRNPTHTTWFYWDGDALLGEVRQAHDAPDAAPVWVGNVANLIEVKRRKEKLAKLHERTREYVYYPGTFVPLALVEKEQGVALRESPQPATTSISQISRSDAPAVADHALVEGRGTDSDQSPGPSASAGMPTPPRTPFAPLGVLASSAPKVAQADGAAKPATMTAPTAVKPDKAPDGGGLGMLGEGLALGQGAGTKVSVISEASAEPVTSLTKSDASADEEKSNVISFGMRLDGEQSSSGESPRSGGFGVVSNTSMVGSVSANVPVIVSNVRETAQFVPSDSVERAAWRSVSYHYHSDPNGCPTRLTAVSGNLVWAAAYSAWGIVDIFLSVVENNLRFQGQYCEIETGMHYNRFRYYDATLGNFVSQDPLALRVGENVYEFAPNSLNWIDPLGLNKISAVLTTSSGEVIDLPTFKSSPGAKKIPGRTEDAEQKLLRHIEENYGEKLAGSSLEIKSEPSFIRVNGKTIPIQGVNPCDDCGVAMQSFAKRNKMDVTYSARDKNFRYKGCRE
ncbi:RHS repeat-associated core domain-containing protein, partial [Xanthomonas bromi]